MVKFSVDVCSRGSKLLLSCFLVSAGAGLLLFWSYIFNVMLRIGFVLRENSYLEKLWLVNPMPLYLEVYTFNWTNPEDIYKPGVKPKFKEIGPFSFHEVREKGNVTFNKNGTVSFRQYHTYHFDPERSISDLNLPITTLNPVLVSAAYTAKIRDWGFWMQKGMQFTFNQMNQQLAITKPVGQYLFEGYPDNLVKISGTLPLPFIPNLPMNGRFSWFVGRNRTSYEGDYNMGTNYDNFGVLQSWNYSNRTSHYDGTCGSLDGISVGELYKPYPDKESISFFVPDMCRSMTLDFQKEEDVNGVIGRKYAGGKRFLDNGTLYSENKCFCPGECLPSGAMNISSCKYGSPGFVSFPNFNGADEWYLNSVEGMHPNASRHDFYITLEPTTGIPMRVAARLQLNLLLEPAKYIKMLENVPKLVFPVLWFEEVVEIPNFLLVLLKILLYIPLVLKIIGVTMMVIGVYIVAKILHRELYDSFAHAQHKPIQVCTIKEMVPLNKQDKKLKVVYETDVRLVSDGCTTPMLAS